MHPVLFAGIISVWLLAGASDQGSSMPAEKETWPQWRGPYRDGRVPTGPFEWPDRLSGNIEQRWRVPLDPSYSSPIVTSDAVFVTETKDRKQEVVRALERATGKQIWVAQWEGAMSVPFFAKENGDWIRGTPAYDGESLYVPGMRDHLMCLDAKAGATRWQIDFPAQLGSPLPAFGFVSSPLVVGDALYVQAAASLVKLDKRTGKIIWQALKDEGGMWGSAFSSPYLATLAGRQQLLVQTRQNLCGVDPESGTVLWSREIPAFRGMNILTPTVHGDSIFTSSYGGKSFLFTARGSGNAVALEETWTSKETGYMSTPVVIGGHAYLHLRNQRFTCIDLATGKSRWTTKPYGKYWSLVAKGDKILALDERGDLYLIRANPEQFELLDSYKISTEPTWAHLAVCGDELFVRELRGMARHVWKDSKGSAERVRKEAADVAE